MRGESRQGFLDLFTTLLADQVVARAGVVGRQMANQVDSRFVGEFGDPAFAHNAPPLGEQVLAVGITNPLAGDQPEPAKEGECLVLQVVVHPFGGLGEGFLNDVRRIKSSRQAPVQARRDHAPEVVAVSFE